MNVYAFTFAFFYCGGARGLSVAFLQGDEATAPLNPFGSRESNAAVEHYKAVF